MQDFIAERAQGTYVYTTDGQKHLDMAAGTSSTANHIYVQVGE